MKICSIQAMIAITLCSMALAHENYGQVLDRKITISLKEVSIEEALEAIEELTYVKFFYSVDQLGIEEKISLEAVDRSLGDLLDELLAPYQIKYKVHDKKATITLKREQDEMKLGDEGRDTEKLRVAAPYSAGSITGRVTDASTQQPMAGVNIIIKGTTNGTSSDGEGFYTINAENSDILVFSFIGYKTLEESVNGRSVIDILLEEEIAALDEIEINAGYWHVTERKNPGNISKVTAKEIAQQPITTPMEALAGRTAGVFITQPSGMPGSGIDIQIRGQNSLRDGPTSGIVANGNLPLYVVDGVPIPSTSIHGGAGSTTFNSNNIAPINNINPYDIESVEILKDADATAIYGSRGANGVVLITTKKGKPGRTSFDLTHSTGVGEVAGKMDLLNSKQYRSMIIEGASNDGFDPLPQAYWQFAPSVYIWDSIRYTDWQKVLLGGTANYNNTQFSITGGSTNTQFLLSGSYFDQTTVFPGDFSFDRGSGLFNMIHLSPNTKFSSSITLNFVAERNQLPKTDPTAAAMSLPPTTPEPFDSLGNLNFENNTFLSNPYAELRKPYEARKRTLLTSAIFGYIIMPGLKVKANLGYNYIALDEIALTPIRSKNPSSNPTGSLRSGNGMTETWSAEPQIEYAKELGSGELTTFLGTTFQSTQIENEDIVGFGYSSDALLGNISAAPSVSLQGLNKTEYRYNAIFARINYTWKDKYIINITGRRDGSSRFGPKKQFGNFGALGAAWIFSLERFVSHSLPLLSFGKVRFSYGTTGSDQIGDYKFLETYNATRYPYLGSTGLIPARLPNDDFGWETSRKLEFGIELGAFGDRVHTTTSYYRNRSSNQLVGIPLAATAGFLSVQANFPAVVENTGWEFELNTVNVGTKYFRWSTSINLTIPKNQLIEFQGIEKSTYANTHTVGKSLMNRKAYVSLGVDPTTGLYTFQDQNGDEDLIQTDDFRPVREAALIYFGGISNGVFYKGIELNFLVQFVRQTGYDYRRSFNYPGAPESNQPTEVLNRWQKAGDNAEVQLFTFGLNSAAYNAFSNQSRRSNGSLVDASFLRLKNVSLSYSFSKGLVNKLKVAKTLRIYIQGQNVFTVTDYLGLDPQSQNNQILPPLRMVTAGIDVGF